MTQDQKTPPGPVFIAWSGKKQVGKDTATAMAVAMLEKANKRVAVTAFAEPLKNIAINVLGLERELVYGSNADKQNYTHINWDTLPDSIRFKYGENGTKRIGPMTVREVLQVLGTDIFREMLEYDVWANSPFRRDWSGYDVVLITDCRFPNEKSIVEHEGGLVIRLVRDTGFTDNHPSETALDDELFYVLYENNGTLEDLECFVRDILTKAGLL